MFLNNPKEDKKTEDFKNLVDNSFNISHLDNLSVLNKARDLKIDIMIDLMGYTSEPRLELFKNRMAKIQVIWLGYCNTSGLKEYGLHNIRPQFNHARGTKIIC